MRGFLKWIITTLTSQSKKTLGTVLMADYKVQPWELSQKQGQPLEIKIRMAENRIKEFYDYCEGQIYISFSGGKDSTVLLDIVRKLYPDVPAVFLDTGLEYPEIRDFVKTFDNVEWLKPKLNFREVIKKYGFPVVSKEFAQAVFEIRNYNLSQKTIDRYHKYKIAKWNKYILDTAPFKISHKCCDVLKKRPARQYRTKTGRHPITGTMVHESRQRSVNYLFKGCNVLDGGKSQSRPLSIWLEQDIWDYIRQFDLPYSKIYDLGYDRTGCMFCMFGCKHDKTPNRFQKMAKTHPKLYSYCLDKIGLREVLDFMAIDYNPIKTIEEFEQQDAEVRA